MRLTVLGCGGAVPDGKRNGPGFFVELDGATLLMDCGAGVLTQMARLIPDWTRLGHIYLSHFHLDHIVELPAILFGLKHAAPEREEGLTILGPAGTSEMIDRWCEAVGYDFLDLGFEVRVSERFSPPFSVHPALHIDGSLALRIDERGTSLGYTGDTEYSADLAGFMAGCDLLVADGGHMSAGRAARMASEAQVGHLVATHLARSQDPEDFARKLRRGFEGTVSVAHDGLVIEI
jgi:ribonuclease BN (tRNA processing enzyme)